MLGQRVRLAVDAVLSLAFAVVDIGGIGRRRSVAHNGGRQFGQGGTAGAEWGDGLHFLQ